VAARGPSGTLCLGWVWLPPIGATALMPNEIGSKFVTVVKIGLQVLLVVGGLLLTLLVLLHKGKGGGLSDMFGGGMSSTMSGSSVAERNLDRFTVALGLVWGASIIGLGLIERYSG
jgi:preprotein translocase subunit SecG